ncbi:ATP-binding protein [Lusitaniella coriacea]|uniref:ATP-binding protein n=1 Tax=Lusitaniella coriacea TaxID=1983105 RepID=UPI003CEAA564
MDVFKSIYKRLAFLGEAISWKSNFLFALLLFTVLGYLGNVFKFPLFFGVDFLFGSIFILLIVQLYGVTWGCLSAFVASLHTIVLWGHPYAVIIFTLEALFVGIKLRTRGKHLLLLDSLYWLCVGMPLVLVFYGLIMQIPAQSVLLIMVKQAINGMFNALIASFLLIYTPLGSWLASTVDLKTTRFQHQLLSLLVCCIFLPAQILIVADSRQAMKNIQTRISEKLQLISTQTQEELQAWDNNSKLLLNNIGNSLLDSKLDLDRSEKVRSIQAVLPKASELEFIKKSKFNTTKFLIVDWGKFIEGNEIDSTKVKVFHQLPIYQEKTLQGTLILKHSLDSIQTHLSKYVPEKYMNIILVDEQQKILASVRSDFEIGRSFDRIQQNTDSSTNTEFYHWFPNADIPLMKLWEQSFYIQKTSWNDFPFQLIVEVSAAPYIDELQASYLWKMSLMLCIILFAVFLSQVISTRIVHPILELAAATTNLPEKILEKRLLQWPQSHLKEIKLLVTNFTIVSNTLEQQFDEIKDTNKTLEDRVFKRTNELQIALKERQDALLKLKKTQLQIVQSEKMSALGNLVAGVAHEINNPTGFLQGNIQPAQEYIQDLLGLIDLLLSKFPGSDPEIEEEIEAIDLEFVREDLPKLIASMKEGTQRIRHISTSLRTFSRTDKEYKVAFNLHDGLDSTILILKHRLKANDQRPAIKITKNYSSEILEVQCFPGQLNQVFMNLIANAIDALDESNEEREFEEIVANPNRITIQTEVSGERAIVRIGDNGKGMPEDIRQRIFEQGFTTKEVGKGTGLGLAIAHQIIVEKHNGTLACHSEPGKGTTFIIEIPLQA